LEPLTRQIFYLETETEAEATEMELVEEKKRDKKLGIVAHSGAQIFTNGILQNAYFLYQCYEALGYRCQFLCYEEDPAPFFKNLQWKQISTNPLIFDPEDYHTIMTITRGVSSEIYDVLKAANVRIVAFVCGNKYVHHQDEFVHGPLNGNTSYIGKGSRIDEMWIIPCYEFSLAYVELIRGAPGYIVPHLWSSELLDYYVANTLKTSLKTVQYSIERRSSPKVNLLILEPNLIIAKTSWLPLMACEKLFQEHPELIEGVHVYNFPSHKHADHMLSTLSVSEKVHKHGRTAIPVLLSEFNASGAMPIILSHQCLNSLNYLYYEALHLGFPLVHNSPDLDGNGYYYPEDSISGCVEQILYAVKHHDRHLQTYKVRGAEYLANIHPLSSKASFVFNEMMEASIAKPHLV